MYGKKNSHLKTMFPYIFDFEKDYAVLFLSLNCRGTISARAISNSSKNLIQSVAVLFFLFEERVNIFSMRIYI